MRLATVASGTFLLLTLTACGGFQGTTATGGTPSGAASTSRGSASMPQSANSLPAGAAVSAPIAGTTGRVGTATY